jgi:hypothetical protein
MTSAFQGSWADDGLKGLLGRKRPTGLGPTSPDGQGSLSLPDLTGWRHPQRGGLSQRPDRPDGSLGPVST